MSRGVNKVIIIGNLGSDPEVKYTANNNAVANITVATSESWTDKNTNEKKTETEWHRVVFYGRLAEIAGEYLRKGSKVYLEGKLKTRKWKDQQVVERYTTEIIANEMQMLESKQMDASQSQQSQPVMQQPQQRPQQAQQGYQTQQQRQQPAQHSHQAPTQGYHSQMPQQHNPPQPQYQDFDTDVPF